MYLSDRAKTIKPSPTLAITAKAKALKEKGIDVVSFGAGEPDFDTPLNIKEAAKRAIDAGFTKYCPVEGTPDLRKAIADKLKKDNSLDYEPSQIIVSCGAKHSLYNLFQAVLNPKDEVIIPAPYWVSYPDMALLQGAKPKIVKTKESNDFKMTPESLKKAITKRTKAVIINSPSNPTGSTYSKEELELLANVCLESKTLIISDEIYEKLVYDGFKFASIASLSREVKEQTVVVNGVSKSYSMTGWRIGYAAGPKEIIKAMTDIQSQSTSNATSISLKAATEALNGPQDEVEKMRQEFEKRRDYIVDRLNKIKGIKCFKPTGAFYVFPNVKKLLGKTYDGKLISTTDELSEYLIEKALIAVVPGDGFGAPGYIRLSYANSMENISKGLDRLEQAVKWRRADSI
ncbi:MAG: pyridoxal phosphate-dependent aminotransferase [Elusimicrobia bacterium]|nr:pyridoxal phosphate-dependent aminotransferase [Candidatus Liberimonas magnetica]